jgi:hypothetical protein
MKTLTPAALALLSIAGLSGCGPRISLVDQCRAEGYQTGTLMFAISSSRHRKSLLVCSSGSAWPPLGKAGGTIMKRRLIML